MEQQYRLELVTRDGTAPQTISPADIAEVLADAFDPKHVAQVRVWNRVGPPAPATAQPTEEV